VHLPAEASRHAQGLDFHENKRGTLLGAGQAYPTRRWPRFENGIGSTRLLSGLTTIILSIMITINARPPAGLLLPVAHLPPCLRPTLGLAMRGPARLEVSGTWNTLSAMAARPRRGAAEKNGSLLLYVFAMYIYVLRWSTEMAAGGLFERGWCHWTQKLSGPAIR
jgi:hypothetical protein